MYKNNNILTRVLICILVLLLSSCSNSNSSNSNIVQDNSEPIEDESLKIEVLNVVDKSYLDAIEILESAGFTNISIEASSDVEDAPDLWIVSSQSVEPGAKVAVDSEIVLTCKRKCKLYLDIKSSSNFFFDTYDIEIQFDGSDLASISNGREFATLLDVLEGTHTLWVYNAENHSVASSWNIDVSTDMTLFCEFSHGSTIEAKSMQVEYNINMAKIEVIDVTGQVLSDAIEMLAEIGITRFTENQDIWNRNNWLVVAQDIEPGTIIDNQTYINLDCVSLDEFFNTEYSGKNVLEIESLAKVRGFNLRFVDSEDNDELESLLSTLTEEEKQTIVAKSARQYGGAKKTASVSLLLPQTYEIAKFKSKQEGRRGEAQSEVNITIDNNEEFASLINSEYVDPDAQAQFTEKLSYKDIIEFDCRVLDIKKYPEYKTRFLYVLVADRPDGNIGCVLFMLENVGYYDFHFPPTARPDSVDLGMKLRMAARVDSGEDPLYIYLQPVWTIVR